MLGIKIQAITVRFVFEQILLIVDDWEDIRANILPAWYND